MASFRALTLQSGKFKQQQDADTLIVGTGVATSSGAMSMDTGSGAAISIGTATATSVEIGRVGQNTNIKGNLQVDGTETVTGSSTMNGNVIFGDAVTDTVLFKGRITSTGQLGGVTLPFLKEEAHVMAVDTSTTADTAGGSLSIAAGGGLGTGAGGALNLDGGAGTTSTGDGGAINIDGGATVGGTAGAVNMATSTSGAVTIGRAATYAMDIFLTPLDGGANVSIGSTAANGTSGAACIGVDGSSFQSIAATDNDLQDILEALDGQIAASSSSLQEAYASGNTIVTSAPNGDLDVSGTEDIVFLSANTVAATPSVSSFKVQNAAATSGDASLNFDVTSANGTANLTLDSGNNLDLNVAASGTLNLQTDAVASSINMGTGAAAATIIIGNNTGATAMNLETGSGGLDIDADGNSVWAIAGTLGLTSTGASSWGNDTGALTISTTTSGTLGISAVALLDIDAGANMDIDVTGTYDMLSTGAFSIDGTGASNVTATTGGLTLSTVTSGDLLVDAAALLDVNAGANMDVDVTGTYDMLASSTASISAAGLTLNATAADVDITTTTSGNIDIDPASGGSFTVDTAGAGSISLDSAAASNFTVSGATADLTLGARGATITLNESGDTTLDGGFTATSVVGALNELFAGVGGSIFTLVTAQTAGETIAVGNLVAIDNAAGTPKVYLADSNGGTELENPIGFAQDAAVLDGALDVIVSGTIAIADAEWDAVPAVGDVGKLVFMSTTPGNLTITAPSSSGDIVQKVGVVSIGGTGAVEIVVQIGDGTEL